MTLPNIHELICLLYIGRCLNIHNTIDQRHTRSACQCFGHFIQKFLLILCISSTAICHTTDYTLVSANRDNSNASGVKNFSDHCMGSFMYCNLLQLCGVGFLIRLLEFIYHLKKSFCDIFLLDVLMTLIDTIQRSKVHYRFQCKLYRTAIGWRVVDANLASVLKVEGRKSPEREIFTDEQVTLILSQKNTPTGQMVIALLACGVRIYELLHFKHEDFHRTESGAYLIGGCKTEAGRNRIIPILDFGIPVFEHAYATSAENGPLFPNGKGDFWNEKNWRNRKFYPFLEEIGIQPNPYDENGKRKPEFSGKLATYTPYTTRHTYASLCDRAGVNKDILKRAVGHTPKSKTLDEVYLHPKATQMIEAFDKANQLLNDEVLALPEE